MLRSGSRPLSAGVGSRNDETRRHNLSTILAMLHHDGAQTRSQLTRRSGLNRSTIGALVGELVELGLVYETAPSGDGAVGRPSPVVHPNEKVVAIAVNPDVDAVVLGAVGLGGGLQVRLRESTGGSLTPERAADIVASLLEAARRQLDPEVRIVGVGLAVPGLVRAADGVVTLAPHLGWRDEPLAARVEERVGHPTYAGNDAHLGAVAETLYGAGRGVTDLVYLNGSASGIGGGVLVGGTPVHGAHGYGGELGHTLVDRNGLDCHCGRRGCLETEVNMPRLLRVLRREAMDAEEFEQALLASSDPAVRGEVQRQIEVLAAALGSFVSAFNPEVIVLGGFLGSLYSADQEHLREAVRGSTIAALVDEVRIERAQLRSRLLMVGGAELAFSPLLSDPAAVVGG